MDMLQSHEPSIPEVLDAEHAHKEGVGAQSTSELCSFFGDVLRPSTPDFSAGAAMQEFDDRNRGQIKPATQISSARPAFRVAIEEFKPGRYWVLLNFDGRSSVTLAMDVDGATATHVTLAAHRVVREALEYVREGGAR